MKHYVIILHVLTKKTRTQLFKTNNIVVNKTYKLSNVLYTKSQPFLPKNVRSFAVQKLLSFFQQKIVAKLIYVY